MCWLVSNHTCKIVHPQLMACSKINLCQETLSGAGKAQRLWPVTKEDAECDHVGQHHVA